MRLALLVVLLAACGGGGGLSREEAEGVPDGDATGDALSGGWRLERRITSCAGDCALGLFGVCDVGYEAEADAEITQTDGHLVVEVDDTPGLLEGGAYADGAVEVGGYATQQGGQLEIAAIVTATVDDDAMTGTIRAAVWGDVDDESVDCRIENDVTATRR
jgi:hypothetical protein